MTPGTSVLLQGHSWLSNGHCGLHLIRLGLPHLYGDLALDGGAGRIQLVWQTCAQFSLLAITSAEGAFGCPARSCWNCMALFPAASATSSRWVPEAWLLAADTV